VTCAMPTGTEGVSLWVRKPFEKYAVTDFDNPFTSRFDECDAMVIFDNVKVPWERVFLLDDVQQSREMYFGTPSHVMGNHQSVVRYHEKLKIILGFAYKAAEMSSVLQVPAVRETLSKLAIAEAGLKGWIAGQIEDAETFGPYLHVNRRGFRVALVHQQLLPDHRDRARDAGRRTVSNACRRLRAERFDAARDIRALLGGRRSVSH